jgi:hypothetical protein
MLGTVPDARQFETPNTLWARLGDNKYWLITYPDGILKFDDMLAKALAKNAQAKTLICERNHGKGKQTKVMYSDPASD